MGERPCAGCPIYEAGEIDPLTAIGYECFALLGGGPAGLEQYRLTGYLVTPRERDFIFTVIQLCEKIVTDWQAMNAEVHKPRPGLPSIGDDG